MADYQNMFNRDFYPTPVEVIEQMLSLTDLSGKIVLEPSAGSGNIVDYCKDHGARDVIACEINDKLRAVVASKCKVIAKDFLKVTPDMISHVDVIIMNPPFSAEEAHLLHAWDIAPEGCEIISLCNSKMIEYCGYTNRNKIREIIKLNGGTENLGRVFENAERSTDVSVSVIRLYKPRTGKHEFDGFFDLSEDDEARWQTGSGVVKYDFVQDLVSRYKDALDCFDDVMAANKRINELCSSVGSGSIVFGAHKRNNDYQPQPGMITRDEFRKQLQKDAWQSLFDKFNMRKYVTRSVIEDLNRAIERIENMPFTMKNIYRLVQSLVQTHGDRMQGVLVEAFEHICSLSAENSTAGEKWKTNSDYMINRRFIVPYMTSYDSRWPRAYVETSYSTTFKIEDILKALCYLTGQDYNKFMGLNSFLREYKTPWGEWRDWVTCEYDKNGNKIGEYGFFRIRGYKKGTMHFEFLDENVWYKFNQAVASVKGWQLPKQHEQKTRKRA